MRIIKRLSSLFICFAVTLFSIVSMSANASYYQDKEPFNSLYISNFSSYSSKVYDYDYLLLVARKFSTNSSKSDCYDVSLILVEDVSDVGKLYFSCDDYPESTFLHSGNHSYLGITTDYSFYKYSLCNVSRDIYLSPSNTVLSVISSGSLNSDLSLLTFDSHNFDKFPIYTSSNGALSGSSIILASNVDLYDYSGNLIQYGNYHTLLQYFDGSLDQSRIYDYSGHETAPGVTVPDTTEDSSSSNNSSEEQLKVSNNILTNVKNLLETVFNLPLKIAEALGDLFTRLKDGIISALETLGNTILNGLKTLFVPSDNLFDDLQETLETKFKFIYQILDLGESLISADFLDEPPNNKITIWGVEVTFMNWELYEPYRDTINTIIIIVSYYFYIHKVIKRLPGIIGGLSSDDN